MNIRKLRLEHVGPINKAEVEFGDLTVLVGPQASGKSIFLQFLKLVVDSGAICETLQRDGLEWSNPREFLEVYLGEGMGALWKPKSKLAVDGRRMSLPGLTAPVQKTALESLFYIPAQRVLTLSQGWPRSFDQYDTDVPFVVRDFSEKLRLFMARTMRGQKMFFSYQNIGLSSVRDRLQHDIFAGFRLKVDKHQGKKRLVLRRESTEEPLPFMVWSAGQRETVPLLLGYFRLVTPVNQARREKLGWVVIEEPEMGLHPRAISVVLLLVLDLLARGHRVCLSTHSQDVLDLVWALGILQKRGAEPKRLLELFGVAATPPLMRMSAKIAEKRAKVYFFEHQTGEARDISSLDPGSADPAVADWGGLSEFGSRVGDVVARVVNETE
jgi:hypothetical protein